jgi:hypothetical protein
VRLAVSTVASSTWKFELRVRAEHYRLRGRGRMRCARRQPPPSYWGMFDYSGHHWRVLKCTISGVSYSWQMIHDMIRDFKLKTIFSEQNLCEWLDQAIKRANDAKRATGCSAPKLLLSCCFLRSVSFNYLFRSLQVLALNACCIFLMLKFELTKMLESSSLEVGDSNILCYATEWRLFFWHVTIRWQVAAILQDQYR